MPQASTRSLRLAAVAAIALGNSLAHAAAVPGSLFTTVSDFSLWTSRSPTTVTATTEFDFDGSPFNGIANADPGGTSTPGSLKVVTLDVGDSVQTVNLAGDATFMAAFDPGSTPTSTAAYSGPLSIIYTVPTNATGGNFSFGLNLAYTALFYDDLSPIAVHDDGLVDGLPTRTAVFDYTIQPGAMSEFYFRVAYNSSAELTSPFYIDAIYVPEPAGAASLLVPALLLRRRRGSIRND